MIQATEQRRLGARRHAFLCWTWNFLFLIGVLAVAYVAFVLLHARNFQEVANTTLDGQMNAQGLRKAAPSRFVAKQRSLLGRIAIPRLGILVAIVEGTTSSALEVGVGHIEGTALPGEPGNIGIAGHRDTFFRGLKDIQLGDEIRLEAEGGTSHYRVDTVQIVAPSDTSVLAPSSASAITLVTCYPFHFIGAAPQRFVVHAHLE